MKKKLVVLLSMAVVCAFATGAMAGFDHNPANSALVLVITDRTSEYAIDLGYGPDIDFNQTNVILAPAGTFQKDACFSGTRYQDLKMQYASNWPQIGDTAGGVYFSTTVPITKDQIDRPGLGSYQSNMMIIILVSYQSASGGGITCCQSTDFQQSYYNLMLQNGSGGDYLNSLDIDDEYCLTSLAALGEGGAGYVDMFLYRSGIDEDFAGFSQAVVRLNADGSVVLNPGGANMPPNLTPPAPVNVDTGSEVTFAITAQDDGDPASLGIDIDYGQLVGDSPALADTSVNGSTVTWTYTWTPDGSQIGDYTFTVTVSDGENDVTATFRASVTDSNHAPVLQPIGPVSGNEGDQIQFDIVATDDDTSDTLELTVEPTPPFAIPSPVVESTTRTWHFVWTPDTSQEGEYPYTVTVTDGKAQHSQALSISIADVNQPPELAPIGSRTVREGDALTLTILATDFDEDILTYTVAPLPENASLNSETGAFTWVPGYDQSGEYSLTFTVSDDDPGSADDWETITVTVENTNRAPVINPIPNQTAIAGEAFTLNITGSDPDNDGLTYLWNQSIADASLDSSSGEFSWTAGAAGNYPVQFWVVDSDGLESTTRVNMTISVGGVNQPPEFQTTGPQEVTEGVLLTFNLLAVDPDGDVITYDWDGSITGAELNGSVFSWTPAGGDADGGPYTVVFTAEDNGEPAESDTLSVVITVNPNHPPSTPSIISPNGGQVNEPQDVELVVSNAADQDVAAGQTLRYRFQVATDPEFNNLVDPGSDWVDEGLDGRTVWTVSAVLEENRTYFWRAWAFDGIAESQWVDAGFLVNAGNDIPEAPVALMPAADSVLTDAAVTLTIRNGCDPDGDSLMYDFRVYTDSSCADAYLYKSYTAQEGENTDISGQTAWEAGYADNTAYWWRVRANDGKTDEMDLVWTAPFRFVVDTQSDVPSPPSLFYSLNVSNPPCGTLTTGIYDGEVTTKQPFLVVTNAQDPDVDSELVYYFELIPRAADGACGLYEGDAVIASGPVPEGAACPELPADDLEEGYWELMGSFLPWDDDHTAWRTPYLSDETRYCWRVWAVDEDGNESQPVESELFVNLENDPPTTPLPMLPVHMSEISDTQPALRVSPSTDSDGDSIVYLFKLYSDSSLDEEFLMATGDAAEQDGKVLWTVPGQLEDDTAYFWTATASDNVLESAPSQAMGFTVAINDIPSKPAIDTPRVGTIVSERTPTLAVVNAVDPDGDMLVYQFELYADKSLNPEYTIATEMVAEQEGKTAWTVPLELNDDMTYYWRVRVSDNEYESSWTQTGSFRVRSDLVVRREASREISADNDSDELVEVSGTASPVSGVQVIIPPGALVEDVVITIGYVENPPSFPDDKRLLGQVVAFGPSGIHFNTPVTIRIPYSIEGLEAVGAVSTEELTVFRYLAEENAWEDLPVRVDPVHQILECEVDHFSLYAAGKTVEDLEEPYDQPAGGGGGDDDGNCFIASAAAAPLKPRLMGSTFVLCLMLVVSLMVGRRRKF